MAAYSAADAARREGRAVKVTVLEKMPRAARKIVISGKGRCNLSNVKPWQDFSTHIHPKANPLRSAFQSLTPEALMRLFEDHRLKCVVERGDRAFPESHKAMDVVDTLVNMVRYVGATLVCDCAVLGVRKEDIADGPQNGRFILETSKGVDYCCDRLIITCGGVCYPSTGSSGDGHKFATELGHKVTRLYPALTALVPHDYKIRENKEKHIDRSTALGPVGKQLCGRSMKNVTLSLFIDRQQVQSEFGDIDFTDGGLEGPIGYKISRRAVIALENGSKVSVEISFPDGSKPLYFDIDGYVGYERAVVTNGGVSMDEIIPKTMASRLVPGLFFAGEVLDYDADTGGYNLQLAFSTGHLAGESAVK